MKLEARVHGEWKHIDLTKEGDRYRGRIGDRDLDAEVIEKGPLELVVNLDSRAFDVTYSAEGVRFIVDLGGREVEVEILDPLRTPEELSAGRTMEGRQAIRAAMPGKIVKIKVAVGDRVHRGQGLVVVEAMKMENEVPSPKEGKVVDLAVTEGQTVETGALLAAVE